MDNTHTHTKNILHVVSHCHAEDRRVPHSYTFLEESRGEREETGYDVTVGVLDRGKTD